MPNPEPDAPPEKQPPNPGPVRRLFAMLGPGLTTGASDDDPSGIGTYSAAGASAGYGILWTAFFTFPFMVAVQYVCAKIAMVYGTGLAKVIRDHYPRWLYPVVTALVVANVLNAAADLAAIAEGIGLLVPVPTVYLVVPVGLGILALQVFAPYRLIARVFQWLTLSLFAYIASAVLAKPDWGATLRGTLVPTLSFDPSFLMLIVAIFGTTISPYLFFWQASQEVEEEISRGRRTQRQRRGATDGELQIARWDVSVGMLFSNSVMFFIIMSSAATLHQIGYTEVRSAAEAAEALRPVAGEMATTLMALGLIGTGVLAVPVLTGSAAYAVAEARGWPCSLDAKPRQAGQFYAVIGACSAVAILLNLTGFNPMKALVWSAVVNGFLAPPLLVLILLIANNRKVMGKRVNGRWLNVLGWATAAVMQLAVVGLVWSWFAG